MGHRGHDSSPNESPDRVRKKKEAKWLARTLKPEVAPFSSEEIGIKHSGRRERTGKSHAKTPGEETEIEFLDKKWQMPSSWAVQNPASPLKKIFCEKTRQKAK